MGFVGLLNLIGSLILLATLVFILLDRRRIIADNTKLMLSLTISVMLLIKIGNALEYLGISDDLNRYIAYVEILLPLFWAALIYSIHSNSINDELVKSLHFQNLALEGANQGLWSWDIRTGQCTFDRRWCEIMGYSRDEIEPAIDSWTEMINPEDKPCVDRVMDQHLRGEIDVYEIEQRLRTKSGDWKWVLDKGRVIERDAEGAPLVMAGTLLDIDASKALDQELAASRDMYRTVFENTGAATIIIEENTSISMANQRAFEMLGVSREQLDEGVKWTDYVCDEDLGTMLDYHKRRRSGDKTVPNQYECHFKGPEGGKLNILITVAVIPNTTKSVASLLDITDLKKSEERRVEMEREIRYAQRLESLGVMAGGIAHDFNNLLMVILGNADLIRSDLPESTPLHQNSEQIIEASRKAADICRQMLAYSGDQHLVVDNIDLNLEIRKISRMLEMSVARNAILKYKLSDGVPRISADIMQIRQVILNLVINASEAVERDSGYITLATGTMDCSVHDLKTSYINDELAPGKYAYIKVYDTGIGMDDHTQRHIFDPFFTTKFPGRGLGMSTVLGVVRSHKGVVKIDSEVENGTTVTVLLPISPSEPEAQAAVESGSDKKTDTKGYKFSKPRKVLIVDDEDGVLAVACSMLKTFGLQPVAAYDGREAIDKFKLNPDIECILMDLSMPHMSGDSATREIRKLDENVPILISSGYGEEKIKDRFAELKIDGFISKPYESQTLIEKLRDIFAE